MIFDYVISCLNKKKKIFNRQSKTLKQVDNTENNN